MSAPAFTPGPWRAEAVSETAPCYGVCAHGEYKPLATGIKFAADASLIAAAPELYALLAILEWGDDERPGCPFCGMGKETGHLERCQMNDALNSVRGEQ